MSVSAARTAGNSVRHSPRRFLRNAWLGLQARALRSLAAAAPARRRLPAHLRTGLDGERESIFYLRRQGYTIVARRWRNAKLRGDLDLIGWDESVKSPSAKDAATLCFIEIKTRSRRDALPAEMAVDADKQETLRRLALAYIRRLPPHAQQAPVRFDVLSVYLEGMSHEGGIQSIELTKSTEPGFVLNKGAFQWA